MEKTKDTDEMNFEQRCQLVESRAEQLFSRGVVWTTFFRELLGPEGLVRQLFRTPQQLAEFEKTIVYEKIQEMFANLRRAQEGRTSADEPVTVITLRVPRSLHEAIAEEAHALKTNINRLCISKLAQIIDTRFVPPLRHLDRHAEETTASQTGESDEPEGDEKKLKRKKGTRADL